MQIRSLASVQLGYSIYSQSISTQLRRSVVQSLMSTFFCPDKEIVIQIVGRIAQLRRISTDCQLTSHQQAALRIAIVPSVRQSVSSCSDVRVNNGISYKVVENQTLASVFYVADVALARNAQDLRKSTIFSCDGNVTRAKYFNQRQLAVESRRSELSCVDVRRYVPIELVTTLQCSEFDHLFCAAIYKVKGHGHVLTLYKMCCFIAVGNCAL